MKLNDLLKLSQREFMKVALDKKLRGEWTIEQYLKILNWYKNNHKKPKK